MMMKRCLFLVCLTLAVVASVASEDWEEEEAAPVAVVAMLETDALSSSMVPTKKPLAKKAHNVGCKSGFRCPIVDGVCCAGGNHCCPFQCRSINATKIICIASTVATAARAKAKALVAKSKQDQIDQAIADKEEAKEVAYAHAQDLKESRKEWKDNLADEKRAQVRVFTKQKNKILSKLKVLAAKTGKNVSSFMPANLKRSIKKRKQAQLSKLAAMTPAQREAASHIKATAIKPAGAWSNFHKTYDVLRVQTWRNICLLSGTVTGQKGVIARVPAACRPQSGRLVFTAVKENTHVRVDIYPDGRIYQVTSNDRIGWVSLSGITYSFKNGTDLFLKNGWVNYMGPYAEAQGSRAGDLCLNSGLITGKKWGNVAEVDKLCHPERRLIMDANNNEKNLRVDMLQNGTISTIGSNFKNNWFSLSNMVYMRTPGTPITLLNEWKNHEVGKRYRKASFNRVGNVVVVSGVVKAGKGNSAHIGTLPPNFRPIDRLVFGTNHHTRTTRIDITKDGKIIYVFGRQLPWVSLDGISFYAIRQDTAALADEENGMDVKIAEKNHTPLPKLRYGAKGEEGIGSLSTTEEGQRSFDTQAMHILKKKLADLTQKYDPESPMKTIDASQTEFGPSHRHAPKPIAVVGGKYEKN